MKKSILIIDNNPLAQKLLILILEAADFYVQAAIDSKDALTKVRLQMSDAIVLDVNMSLKDGLSICHELRHYQEMADLPIILLSNCTPDQGDKNCLPNQIKHLYKPISHQQLVREVEQVTLKSLPLFE